MIGAWSLMPEHVHLDRMDLVIFDWSNKDDEYTSISSFIWLQTLRLGDSDDEETDVSEVKRKLFLNSEKSEISFETGHPTVIHRVGQESRTRGLGNKGCVNYVIGSRETRPVWNNIQRVNHSNFARNSRNLHQRRSFIPSAVLTRDGLISTARPKITQTVPSKSTANVTYQGTARSRVPQAVLSRSTDGSYYPRMDSRRPRISSYSPSSRSSTTRTPHRPQRPKKIVKSIWVKKGSTVGSQAVLPQTVKKSAMISPKQTWRPKGKYLDSVNRGQSRRGSQKDYAIIDCGCSGSMTGDKDMLSDFKEFKGGFVAFGNDSKGGRISGKGTIKTSCLDFEKVSYFMFVDEDSVGQQRIEVSYGIEDWGMSTSKISTSWLKAIWASCKKIEERTVREPLELLHMDLFWTCFSGECKWKKYCFLWWSLMIAQIRWVFSWPTWMKHYDMLHDLIVGFGKQAKSKVMTIRWDSWNRGSRITMNEFCAKKESRENYSMARTQLQNVVAEERNRTLMEC
ncbi:hypothetical protein Tco_0617398 [Tanacetum coccineum]